MERRYIHYSNTSNHKRKRGINYRAQVRRAYRFAWREVFTWHREQQSQQPECPLGPFTFHPQRLCRLAVGRRVSCHCPAAPLPGFTAPGALFSGFCDAAVGGFATGGTSAPPIFLQAGCRRIPIRGALVPRRSFDATPHLGFRFPNSFRFPALFRFSFRKHLFAVRRAFFAAGTGAAPKNDRRHAAIGAFATGRVVFPEKHNWRRDFGALPRHEFFAPPPHAGPFCRAALHGYHHRRHGLHRANCR